MKHQENEQLVGGVALMLIPSGVCYQSIGSFFKDVSLGEVLAHRIVCSFIFIYLVCLPHFFFI